MPVIKSEIDPLSDDYAANKRAMEVLVATEEVVELLENQGFSTGVDLKKLSKINQFIQEKILDLKLKGK